MNWLNSIEESYLKTEMPKFRAGDTVRVSVRITEGEGSKQRVRLQAFEGVCIRRHNASLTSTFTVRKISNNIGVERIFPLHSPMIEKIDVIRQGKVRQSRIYYIRKLRGKAARIKPRNQYNR